LKPERWRQIDQILKAALDQEETQRAGFLDQACGEDEALRKKVEALLAAHRRGEDFLEEPALEMAAKGIAKHQIEALVGKQLGSYKILSFIAAGGMGEVYRARDTQLEREVAIKVLPAEFTQDPERLARFQREAKLLAALNHPNIAAIHGLEESDGIRFLVLELVEGETLAERIAKGPLPVEEALEVCRQIAEGLEAAHEKGIVHRDLKPANVRMTPEGKVKILDFGLAKAFEGETPVADISQSPTLTEDLTKSGVILGTAAYMSPEQARGKQVDRRTDVWALSCVLYELLTGKRSFEGETVTEIVASVLKSEPDWERLPDDTPGVIRSLLQRCLRKDPHRRLQHVGDIRVEIEDALSEPETLSPIRGTKVVQPPLWRRMVPWVLAGCMAVIALLALWNPQPTIPSSPEMVKRFTLALDSPSPMTGGLSFMALSPDGQHLVYKSTKNRLHHRSMDQAGSLPIPGTEGGEAPFFSPDGQWVGFYANDGLEDKLKKVSLTGGAAQTIAANTKYVGASWGPNGNMIFGGFEGLHKVSAAGGTPENLTTSDSDNGEIGHVFPEVLPDGKAVLFTIQTEGGSYDKYRIGAVSLETGEQKTVLEGGSYPRYSPTGHLLYVTSEGLLAAPFDARNLEVTGNPILVLEDISISPWGVGHFAVSDEGTLIHLPATREATSSLVWVDRQGVPTLATTQKRNYALPRVSPDGKRVTFAVLQGGSPHSAWMYSFEDHSFDRLTFGTWGSGPEWTPDGKWIAFLSNPDGRVNLYRQLVDRSRPAERFGPPGMMVPNSWLPDGSVLSVAQDGLGGWDVGILAAEGDEEPQPLIASPSMECCSKFSPDGKWLAYVSNELGRNHVYVRPYPAPDVKFLVSDEEGGGEPVWAPDGSELFYRNGDRMMIVSVQKDPTFNASEPKALFVGSYLSSGGPSGFQYYDVSPDGKRFIMIKGEVSGGEINVVLNWFEELKRLVLTD